METHEEKTEGNSENKSKNISKYLIRKYGKEPRITEEEMKQNRWNWH